MLASLTSQTMPASVGNCEIHVYIGTGMKYSLSLNIPLFKGNLVIDGVEILNNGGMQNAHFGIKKDGSLFMG